MSNGYIKLKIELQETGIMRTIVVPQHMTLTDLHYAVQAVMGWEDAHLWHFMDKRRDGIIYELPHEDDFNPFSKRLTIDASKVSLRKVFPERGAKLLYEYDFGDGWEHRITRMTDPKEAGIACVKAVGPEGIEDFGGQWRLAEFIEKMKTDPDCEEYDDIREWAGLDSLDELNDYLYGVTVEKKTNELRRALSHVKDIEKIEGSDMAPMTEEEKANVLGNLFAVAVSERIWKIIAEALRNGGSCEFDDPDKDISEFLLTFFEGLKVKDGRSSLLHTEPSHLTVLPQWVEMYKTHGKKWDMLHEQYDILENYAASSVNLYGAVSVEELHEIVLHYDPNCVVHSDEMLRILSTRAASSPGLPFRIEENLLISNEKFPFDIEGVEKNVKMLRKEQSRHPRWYPGNRSELFKYEDLDSFETTPESKRVEFLLHTISNIGEVYDEMEVLAGIYHLLVMSMETEVIYEILLKQKMIPNLTKKTKLTLFEAIDDWGEVVHMPFLNGNTIKSVNEYQSKMQKEQKVGRNEPCPCGSGKKYKHCCARK